MWRLKTSLFALCFMMVTCLNLTNAATQAPNTGQPKTTTTPPPDTTTTATTTTTAAPTTSADPATTTQQDSTTQAQTTASPKTYCGGSSNGLFLPFGTAEGDTRLNAMDDGCYATPARTNGYKVAFADKCFKKFHICVNGLVCLQNPYQGYVVPSHGVQTSVFQNRYCMAPFLMNLDTTNNIGAVWFHEYDVTDDFSLTNDSAVRQVQELVATQTGNPASDFTPVYVLVVTWDSVPREDGPLTENVTFQLLYTSDGVSAYSFYAYKQGGMGISSGDVFIGQIVNGVPEGVFSTSVDLDKYRDVDETLRWPAGDCYGATVYYHSSDGCKNTATLRCKNWHSREKQSLSDIQNKSASLPQCPCSIEQTGALFDPVSLSDVTTTVFYTQTAAANINFAKSCGYRKLSSVSASFITNGKDRGSFARYNYKTNAVLHQKEDLYYKNTCCNEAELCDLYFEVRPASQNCEAVPQVATSNTAGDPHFTTIDGLTYTFNGHGEYHLLKIDNIGFDIQARTGRVIDVNGTSGDATVFTGFAVKGNNFWMQAVLNSDRKLLEVLSGTSKGISSHVDHSLEFSSKGNAFTVTEDNLSMRRSGETLIVAFPGEGILMNITKSAGLLSSIFSIEGRHKGKTSGLLGNYNFDVSDDLIPRSSTTAIPSSSNEEAIFLNFGKTWITTEGESQFAYRAGKTHASYNFPDFTPLFESSFAPEDVAKAKTTCGEANKQCIFDLLLSADESFALGTLTAFDDFRDVTAVAENQIPTISVVSGTTERNGAFYLQTTLDTANTVKIKAADDGTVTTSVSSTINGLQRTNNTDGSVSVTFSLTNTSPVSLSVIATDNLGVTSPELVINIVICKGCSNHGSCDYTAFQESQPVLDNFKLAVCQCEVYWEGDNCELDVDGCATSPCFEGQKCNDTDADANKNNPSLPAYTCSACPQGYEDNGVKCIDIDECTLNNPCTSGTCVNTAGSFRCECNSGYRLEADMVTCKDINECDEETDGCDQICVNTAGSFNCSCLTGYKRNSGNTACEVDAGNTDVRDACLSAGCDNADGCTVDENNSGVCFCNSGYTLNQTDNTCGDINECDLGVCSQDCVNNVGSYTCKCLVGYKLAADGVTCDACTFPSYGVNCASTMTECPAQQGSYDSARGCVCKAGWEGSDCNSDINECSDANICGDINKVCTNTRGSYTCLCRDGYQNKDDGTCIDVDECADITTNACQQVCVNTNGAYTCGCNAGFNVDPTDTTKCKDIDECVGSSSGCQQICVNIDGGFNCDCNAGYELGADRKTCNKLEDVCKGLTSKNCSDICNVVNNAPVCSCGSGYYLATDQQTCIDVNECGSSTLNLCSVKSSCVNTEGGYQCSCAKGFRLENDRRTCTECDEFTYGENCAEKCDCGVGASACDSVTGCVCKAGWTGVKCDTDKDECQTNPCTAVNQMCVNTPGSYECQCKPGYKKDQNGNCTNINECIDANLNTCSQICTDMDGSFECSCNPGFLQDGNNCNDINECEGGHGCEQICTNLVGGYRCSCPENYKLNDDKRTCSPLNECSVQNYCSGGAICARIGNNDTCRCKTGYTFDTGSTTSCVDIKECGDENSNKCNQRCTELAGSYMCSCEQTGYVLDADDQTCIKCKEGKYGGNCTETCACETANGNTKSCDHVSGSCTCNAGWEGVTCGTNINECTRLTEPCPPNSACSDNDGSYTCICSTGYIKAGDGTCTECDATHFGVNCAQTCSCNATNTKICDKISGACTCASGWNGSTCNENIDECQTANICNDTLKTCSDTEGSFTCSCIDDYTANSENVCIDDDECLLGTDTCTEVGQKCVNAVPGFTCVCSAGYSGTSGSTCTPCPANTWGDQCSNTCACNSTTTNRCDPSIGCVCKPGWTGDDCGTDIDECALGIDDCITNAICTNTQGNFSCACATGYQNINETCSSCSNNSYGDSCSTTCNCVATNSIIEVQTCNHITGRCECKATWTGNRCQTDIDECAADTNLCKSKPNQGCHNTNGSYECSCFLGYERNQDGTCVDSNATTTSLPVPANAVGIDMFLSLNLSVDSISLSHNLTVQETNDLYNAEAERAIKAYFESEMTNTNFLEVKVYSVAEGSLDAKFIVLVANTDAARKDLANAVYGLRNTPITVFGQNTLAQALRIGSSTTINPQTDTETTIKCLALSASNGKCQNDEDCVLENGQPVCRIRTTDNFALVIGLGVGIPLFFIALLILAVCIVYVTKRKRRNQYGYRSSEFDRQTFDHGGFFPSVLPTKINTIGRNDPVYVPYNWDDQSTISASSSDDNNKKRRRRRRGETYPGVDNEAFYSNAPNNFSWDFMYNYIAPHEKYEIQRPQVDHLGLYPS